MPADKGTYTVVMDKDVYNEKVMTLLEDETTYRKLKKYPTTREENKMNAMLLDLKNKGILAEELYRQLRSSGGQIPLFYGLPKIHKTGTPLRPIVSFISSPTYALSKFLSKILSPLVEKKRSPMCQAVWILSHSAKQSKLHKNTHYSLLM